ncbi:MAG: hypothetical protein HQK50_14460 [Oligoflexia bacterium]|nr:hypothetical protein [Oligoflexia bacterium]
MSYTKNRLGAHHLPDLFHVQQDISRAVSAPMAGKSRAAINQVEESEEHLESIMGRSMNYHEDLISRGRGRPIDFEKQITTAIEDIEINKEESERLSKLREELKTENKKLGELYHYVDLQSGKIRKEEKVINDMGEAIVKIKQIAEEEGLNEKSLKLIDKAADVLPKMEATLKFVSSYVKEKVDKMPLTTVQRDDVFNKCKHC